MNIVLPYIHSRTNNDTELKYSLRCLPEHDKLYVIGRNPNLPNIIHIPFEEKKGLQYAAENIYNKILYTFTFLDEFICWADDYFVLPGFDYSSYYYDGMLEDKLVRTTSDDYRQTVKNTINYLKERNLPTRFFNCHCPIIYRKELFPVIDKWPLFGYAIKSIYCNFNGIEGVAAKDLKIKQKLPISKIEEMIKGRTFFSTREDAINQPLIGILEKLYQTQSKYEKVIPLLIA